MRYLLEVREYEKISCNPDFKTEYAYLPETVFKDLEDFIYAYADDEEHADALEFLKISFQKLGLKAWVTSISIINFAS